MPFASLAAATASWAERASAVIVGPAISRLREERTDTNAFARQRIPQDGVDFLVRMRAAFERTVAAHDADIAADYRAQVVHPVIRPLQVTK